MDQLPSSMKLELSRAFTSSLWLCVTNTSLPAVLPPMADVVLHLLHDDEGVLVFMDHSSKSSDTPQMQFLCPRTLRPLRGPRKVTSSKIAKLDPSDCCVASWRSPESAADGAAAREVLVVPTNDTLEFFDVGLHNYLGCVDKELFERFEPYGVLPHPSANHILFLTVADRSTGVRAINLLTEEIVVLSHNIGGECEGIALHPVTRQLLVGQLIESRILRSSFTVDDVLELFQDSVRGDDARRTASTEERRQHWASGWSVQEDSGVGPSLCFTSNPRYFVSCQPQCFITYSLLPTVLIAAAKDHINSSNNNTSKMLECLKTTLEPMSLSIEAKLCIGPRVLRSRRADKNGGDYFILAEGGICALVQWYEPETDASAPTCRVLVEMPHRPDWKFVCLASRNVLLDF